MKICYVKKRFQPATLHLISQCAEILGDYRAQGYDLTLRGLFYQFVSRDWFPDDRKWTQVGSKWRRDPQGTKNAEPNYKWLGGVVNDARLAGLLDWNILIDRTRVLNDHSSWDTPGDIIKSAAHSYAIDMWEEQNYRPEVWIEKDALLGIIEPVCNEYAVPYFSCRGYTSQSAMWRAAQRLKRHADNGYIPVIIHLGDHDPSGVDMSRDIATRIQDVFDVGIDFERIALSMAQVRKYDPPPNPAKVTDSRAGTYMEIYGDESWELDALEPQVMTQLIRDAVENLYDADQWAKDEARGERDRADLTSVAARWPDVVKKFGLDSD